MELSAFGFSDKVCLMALGVQSLLQKEMVLHGNMLGLWSDFGGSSKGQGTIVIMEGSPFWQNVAEPMTENFGLESIDYFKAHKITWPKRQGCWQDNAVSCLCD